MHSGAAIKYFFMYLHRNAGKRNFVIFNRFKKHLPLNVNFAEKVS